MILREKIRNKLKSFHVYIFYVSEHRKIKKIFSCGQGVVQFTDISATIRFFNAFPNVNTWRKVDNETSKNKYQNTSIHQTDKSFTDEDSSSD